MRSRFSKIQLNLSTTVTLGTDESGRHCREVAVVEWFKQGSMYGLSVEKMAVVERWPLVDVRLYIKCLLFCTKVHMWAFKKWLSQCFNVDKLPVQQHNLDAVWTNAEDKPHGMITTFKIGFKIILLKEDSRWKWVNEKLIHLCLSWLGSSGHNHQALLGKTTCDILTVLKQLSTLAWTAILVSPITPLFNSIIFFNISWAFLISSANKLRSVPVMICSCKEAIKWYKMVKVPQKLLAFFFCVVVDTALFHILNRHLQEVYICNQNNN